jgi:sugar transferase (PEP-CTERM/EpsH1 system associated)
MSSVPLIMHVVYRFSVGGLENGVVNLINRLPRDQFRHAVVALTICDEHFSRRIERDDVEFISLNKPAGHGFRLWPTVWRLFRRYRPAVVHTRNLGALEMQVPAWLAGVPVRIHGEHGRDVSDPDGRNRRHRIARRLYRPFVTGYVAVSRDLQHYLCDSIGIDVAKVSCLCNGVDERRFVPAAGACAGEPSESALSSAANAQRRSQLVVGCVGRLQPIKGHAELLRAVALLLARAPQWRASLRVQLVGDGPLRPALEHAKGDGEEHRRERRHRNAADDRRGDEHDGGERE